MPHNMPFGQMLSYGPNGSPTITVTKTLFSDAQVTSTTTDGSSSTGASDLSGSTITVTTTDSSMATQTNSATAGSNTASSDSPTAQQPGVVAGSVIGSMAAFGMIASIIWYFGVKKQDKKKLKLKLNFRRRKSSGLRTPRLEGQALERTRTIMLQQAELNKSRDSDLKSFFATPVKTMEDPHHHQQIQEQSGNAHSGGSQMGTRKTRPSWIGLAMSSSTPPDTPPLPRSNSQKSTTPSVGSPSSHLPALIPAFGSVRNSRSSSLMPAPLKSVMKPAPIITSPRLDSLDNVSPLSPRGMINAMSSTTKGAWRRASRALSPSSYQRLKSDGPEGTEHPRVDKRPSLPRNPELEIGAQTDKGWDGQWI